jgi:hypothetical protein
LTDRLQALTQGDQALGVKEGVGPTLVIAATAATLASATFAQDVSQPASRVTIHSLEDRAIAVLEVFKPALQHPVEVLTDRFQAPPLVAPSLGAERLLEFGMLFLRGHFMPRSKW